MTVKLASSDQDGEEGSVLSSPTEEQPTEQQQQPSPSPLFVVDSQKLKRNGVTKENNKEDGNENKAETETDTNPDSSRPDAIEFHVHRWRPAEDDAVAVVVLFHGFNAHGMFPSTRYLAELLAEHKQLVYCMDFRGHGQSEGPAGFLPSTKVLLDDARGVCEMVQEQHNDLPLFLAGVSMGASIALLMSLELQQQQQQSKTIPTKTNPVAGLLLLTPMVVLPIPVWQKWVVGRLAKFLPQFGLSKSSSKAFKYMFRDKDRRKEAMADKLAYKGRIRAATAHTCIDLAETVHRSIPQFSSPMLCLLAEEDCVVDNDGIDELMEKASSVDKSLKEYDAYHGLMCEVTPVRTQIESDIVEWMQEHTKVERETNELQNGQ